MENQQYKVSHLTKAYIHLDRLSHNLRLIQELVKDRPVWPAIKANAYGHGAELIARHLVNQGIQTLCVAHIAEAVSLIDAGINANFVLLSATLPEHADAIVHYECQPVLCDLEMARALAGAAAKVSKQVKVHLMVDTGMGRIGIQTGKVARFLDQCRNLPALQVCGIMSHFARADEQDKAFSLQQLAKFLGVIESSKPYGQFQYHMANSAAIFDMPDAYFDAVRPGISIYGLTPSKEIINPKVKQLKPVLEWKTQITFLKEVAASTGLSYGHNYHTERSSLIATIPCGYGDGMSRLLSNKKQVLVHGKRCPQVGRITMDQSLIDVTDLRGKVALGDEAVLIGQQGSESISADELAWKANTINYEVVARISQRVPRIAVTE